MKKVYNCECCREKVTADKAQTYEWAYYCPQCAQRIFYVCANTDCSELETKRFGEDYSTGLCENCYNEKLYS